MATVVKVTMPQYFSCYRSPMTQLCAKFHQDRNKNEEKIMSTTTTPRASAGVQLDAGVRQLQYTCSLGVVQVVLLMYNFY